MATVSVTSELGPAGIPFVRGGDIGDGDNQHGSRRSHPTRVRRPRSVEAHTRLRVAFITQGDCRTRWNGASRSTCVGLRTASLLLAFARYRQLEPRFLLYLLRSGEFQANFDAVKTTARMVSGLRQHVRSAAFQAHNSSQFASSEQSRRYLGALDDKIELNRRMNATLEAMARAIFKSWFVDFDPVRAKLDGRRPTGMDAETAVLFPPTFQDSPLGPIPHGWTVGNFGKIISAVRERIADSNAVVLRQCRAASWCIPTSILPSRYIARVSANTSKSGAGISHTTPRA